jgi:hypothetical protein
MRYKHRPDPGLFFFGPGFCREIGFVMVVVQMTIRVEKGEGLIPSDRIN